MKKYLLLIAAALLLTTQVGATEIVDGNKDNAFCSFSTSRSYGFESELGLNGIKEDGTFTRGKGFVIRPELYRGVFASFGYQINPYVQAMLSVGLGDGVEGAMGIRAYTGEANWVGMFDLRLSLTNLVLPGVAMAAGASYKDLDFGVGFKYYTNGYEYLVVPVITVGWNIRCYDHR